MPAEGNELASGSPLTSSLPENSLMALPSASGTRKLSCFSAVRPVIGWKMWVKWVAPFSMAQSFMALATASAICGSSGAPSLMVFWSALNTGLGSRRRWVAVLKTLAPNRSLTWVCWKLTRLSLWVVVAIALIASRRGLVLVLIGGSRGTRVLGATARTAGAPPGASGERSGRDVGVTQASRYIVAAVASTL